MENNQSFIELLREINFFVNKKVSYKTDLRKFQKSEHWEVALESGDCEDFALAKLHKCLDAVIPIESLMLATCWTEMGEYHAVLLVSSQGMFYVLDNRFNEVLTSEQLRSKGYKFHKRQSVGGSQEWVLFYSQ